ncbi:hypothetical protein JZ751_025373 [Albula glossodonta]|uniref:Uncharacterized protein n=1 Tax=Albula glossodonta TaxID=121402 RepID=A0A8T2NEC3_9TELE|nr:hypothetical protein JZ751_025373 [Albula glossodonta]
MPGLHFYLPRTTADSAAIRVSVGNGTIIQDTLDECETHGIPQSEQSRNELEMKIEEAKENIRKAEERGMRMSMLGIDAVSGPVSPRSDNSTPSGRQSDQAQMGMGVQWRWGGVGGGGGITSCPIITQDSAEFLLLKLIPLRTHLQRVKCIVSQTSITLCAQHTVKLKAEARLDLLRQVGVSVDTWLKSAMNQVMEELENERWATLPSLTTHDPSLSVSTFTHAHHAAWAPLIPHVLLARLRKVCAGSWACQCELTACVQRSETACHTPPSMHPQPRPPLPTHHPHPSSTHGTVNCGAESKAHVSKVSPVYGKVPVSLGQH